MLEFTFHGAPGTPVRLQGREAIREYARHVMASPLRLKDYEVTELHQAQDPAVVIAAMRATATMTTTGRPVTATSIQVRRREARYGSHPPPSRFQYRSPPASKAPRMIIPVRVKQMP